jgi:hypothetical protein
MNDQPGRDDLGDEAMDVELDEAEAQALLARLGDALRAAEPVPEHVLAGARGAFTWRTIDAELAELVFDSATELMGVRGGAEDTARQVTFQAPGVEIEVMVIDDGSRRIVGQLVPPQEATVQLLTMDDTLADTQSDHLGRFAFADVPPGPVRISVLGSSGVHLVHTEWLLL